MELKIHSSLCPVLNDMRAKPEPRPAPASIDSPAAAVLLTPAVAGTIYRRGLRAPYEFIHGDKEWPMSKTTRLQRTQAQPQPVPPSLQLSVNRLMRKSPSSNRVSQPLRAPGRQTGPHSRPASPRIGRTSSHGSASPPQVRSLPAS